MVDRYSKVVLTVIAVGLWTQIALSLNIVSPAKADDTYVIQRILYCIDGSSINSSGKFTTYCDG